ncbi:hypothetical protein V2H45_20850 [Tumidithrix elongata RA019]|uniref:Uncharacterized protein n=1 Tax=Tumidithrix elongata BACA0141 TaxID=2716417 RepID=A0AAW9Q7L0_9CYAN|nr:hypothetical protein [Tumidithrix elongata RA019]
MVTQYWTFVRIDIATGKPKVEEIALAKIFLQQGFPELTKFPVSTDISLHLWKIWRGEDYAESQRHAAQLCLRCYISHQILEASLQIFRQFSDRYGLPLEELLPCVLDDILPTTFNQTSSYISLAREILETFDPERSKLNTWTNRKVRQHRELNVLLLDYGIYLISDWAILNDTTSKQLRQVLSTSLQFTETEIQIAVLLLDRYHEVYRKARLQQRAAGSNGHCQPPTSNQLAQIVKDVPSLSANTALIQLREFAKHLREYRLQSRGGKPSSLSIDDPNTSMDSDRLSSALIDSTEVEHQEFLQTFRKELLVQLDRAIAFAIDAHLERIAPKKDRALQNFLEALCLFHCHGKAMAEIARDLSLKAQYQVSRLLKLKELRADIRREILSNLQKQVLVLAQTYADPQRLQTLDALVEVTLEEIIDKELLEEAESETQSARGHPLASLFAQRLCRYMKKFDC